MLEGWYCRSIANNNADAEDEDEDSPEEEVPNYKDQYRNLKRKLKFLIYENECFQEALRSTQRKLLKVNRDKSFLLDRLLQYEKVDASFSESDETESSEDEMARIDTSKRKKMEVNVNNHSSHHSSVAMKPVSASKKKKSTPKVPKAHDTPSVNFEGARQSCVRKVQSCNNVMPMSLMSDGHMTPEEVERHLESRQSYLELVPQKAPPTVPTEMFSNDPSLDSESNEVGELETSPSNMGEDCLSVDMMAEVPEGCYLDRIEESHVPLIHSVWPHRDEEHPEITTKFIMTMVRLNGGCGLFSKENNELLPWALQSELGAISIVQTIEKYKRKGYAKVVVNSFAKELAENGVDSVLFIIRGNLASETMFKSLNWKLNHPHEWIKMTGSRNKIDLKD